MSGKKKASWVPVFVYGTLKKGFPLAEWMDGSKYLGQESIEGYSLLSLGPYPALIACTKPDGQPDKNYKVSGELWSMPESTFHQLKRMEERVGYTTIRVPTVSTQVEAAAFLFGIVSRGLVEWGLTKESEKPDYEVVPVVIQEDVIPF